MSGHSKSVVVIDNGSGYTKMGYAGSAEPQHIIATAMATRGSSGGAGRGALDDLNFEIGTQEYLSNISSTHQISFPIRQGMIEDWDAMERIWHRCMFDKLRCDPEEHYFLLTEPPMNTPEHREQTAEIMFETFNVPGLHIAVQAVLSLAASWSSKHSNAKRGDVSGLVVDSGEGVTHIIPVADGHVMGSCIKQIPFAGRDLTNFVQQLMRERKEAIPADDSFEVARKVKEMYSYVCPDIVKEFAKYDANPEKYIRKFEGVRRLTGQNWTCDVGFERFLAGEAFFNPEIINPNIISTLPQMVDESILKCPIDTRRKLYGNIVLSGGSTMFKDFGRRLQRDVKKRVDARLQLNQEALGHLEGSTGAQDVDVKVVSHPAQQFAAWLGGSMLASTPQFYNACHTKAQYEEEGPRIARHNTAFNALL